MIDTNVDLPQPSSSEESSQSLTLSHFHLFAIHKPLCRHLNWSEGHASGGRVTGGAGEPETDVNKNFIHNQGIQRNC